MKKENRIVIITYVVLFLIAASMFVWLSMVATGDDWAEISNISDSQEDAGSVTVSEAAVVPIATATPTPLVERSINEENTGCIGDEGLVW